MGPPCLRGIVNLRGNAATVVDLGLKLGLGRTETGRGACLIILERDYRGERALVAALADAVQEVVAISRDEVESPPEMGLAVDPRFLTGLARQDGAFLMAWKPVFSADGAHLAVNVERGGVHTVVCDGKAYPKSFEKCFAPAFSPDGTKVLIRGIEGGKAYRIVAPLEAFTG